MQLRESMTSLVENQQNHTNYVKPSLELSPTEDIRRLHDDNITSVEIVEDRQLIRQSSDSKHQSPNDFGTQTSASSIESASSTSAENDDDDEYSMIHDDEDQEEEEEEEEEEDDYYEDDSSGSHEVGYL